MNHFEEIYRATEQAVSTANLLELDTLKKMESFDIVERIDGQLISPVQKFALQGNVECVKLLLSLGANINDAVRGYAQGGHIKGVEILLERGANIRDAIVGYAQGAHTKLVDALLESNQEAKEPLSWAAQGYAQGGYTQQVDDLILKLNDNKPIDGTEYALYRHHYRVFESIALGYIQGGYIKQIEFLQNNKMVKFNSGLERVYAQGGYSDKLATMEISSTCERIEGYAQGGHTGKVEELLLGLPDDQTDIGLRYAVRGYAKGGHTEQVEDLLKRAASINWAVTGYIESGFFLRTSSVLRLLATISDPIIRENIAKVVLTENCNISSAIKESIPILLKQANRIAENIARGYSFDEVLFLFEKTGSSFDFVKQWETEDTPYSELTPDRLYPLGLVSQQGKKSITMIALYEKFRSISAQESETKKELINNLNDYIDNKCSWWVTHHKQTAISLRAEVKAKDSNSIQALLTTQLSLFGGSSVSETNNNNQPLKKHQQPRKDKDTKDEFYKIIQKYHR